VKEATSNNTKDIMKFEVLRAVLIKIQVFGDVMRYYWVNESVSFQGTTVVQNTGYYSPSDVASHPRGLESSTIAMMTMV
jgi:hypothetical protein